ncbi:MAG: hypothetical protein HQK77_20425 [Desulfobacterales bacterium]|nr:hypothetical protein [Desulfobacterales bacterium]
MTPTKHRKGVGEEVLREEIKNWLEVSAKRKESLMITIGQLNPDKLVEYQSKRTSRTV